MHRRVCFLSVFLFFQPVSGSSIFTDSGAGFQIPPVRGIDHIVRMPAGILQAIHRSIRTNESTSAGIHSRAFDYEGPDLYQRLGVAPPDNRPKARVELAGQEHCPAPEIYGVAQWQVPGVRCFGNTGSCCRNGGRQNDQNQQQTESLQSSGETSKTNPQPLAAAILADEEYIPPFEWTDQMSAEMFTPEPLTEEDQRIALLLGQHGEVEFASRIETRGAVIQFVEVADGDVRRRLVIKDIRMSPRAEIQRFLRSQQQIEMRLLNQLRGHPGIIYFHGALYVEGHLQNVVYRSYPADLYVLLVSLYTSETENRLSSFDRLSARHHRVQEIARQIVSRKGILLKIRNLIEGLKAYSYAGICPSGSGLNQRIYRFRGQLRIADFGSARAFRSRLDDIYAIATIKPPEVISQQIKKQKFWCQSAIDLWELGALLAMLSSYDFFHLFYEHGDQPGLSKKRTLQELLAFSMTFRGELEKELAPFFPELVQQYSLEELVSVLSPQSLDEEDALQIMAWYLLNTNPGERPDVLQLLEFIDSITSREILKTS